MSKSQILVVDDDNSLREAILDTLEISGYNCKEAIGGTEALDILAHAHIDMVISDIQMDGMDGHTLLNTIHSLYPNIPVLLMTAYANIDGAVKAMRYGAVDYLSKPFAPEVLLNQVSRYVPIYTVDKRTPIFGDEKTKQLLAMANKVAQSDATVMITGPSGSGKEVLSRYIHDHSPRANNPFVALNCAAIPETMLEATLFGYEKGAFTGAVQACPGKFEQAQDGTILLDEITEMDLGLQAKLLRVLQEKEVERLGSRKTISLNVRVIATSNRDLKQAVEEGVFREDLYYRLNVFPLRWLPLKDRKNDIIPIAEFIISKMCKEQKIPVKTLSTDAKNKLLQYPWPGNVRELDNVIQRAMIVANDVIEVSDIFFDDMMDISVSTEKVANNKVNETDTLEIDLSLSDDDSKLINPVDSDMNKSSLGDELKQQEFQIILDTLIKCNWSRQAVSEKLGISPRTLRYKIAKMREAGIKIEK
ncbi:MAG: sigma-54-dependent transcriptional regulator [Succinivibrionaceae bacterium]